MKMILKDSDRKCKSYLMSEGLPLKFDEPGFEVSKRQLYSLVDEIFETGLNVLLMHSKNDVFVFLSFKTFGRRG